MAKLIKPEFLTRLRDEEELLYEIAKGMRLKFRTIEKWVREEDKMLTSVAVISIIEKATGLQESDFVMDHPLTKTTA